MAKRKSTRKECVFCGEQATTKDHIPPKAIFPAGKRRNLLTVPACVRCNNSTKKDDEYFRLVIAAAANDSAAAGEVLEKKIFPGARSHSGLVNSIVGSTRPVDRISAGGILLGTKPGFSYQADRIHPVVAKIVKALFLRHTGGRLCADYRVDDFRMQPVLTEDAINAASTLPLHGVHPDVFSYRFYANPDNMDDSYWFLMFYDNVLFFTRTTNEQL